MSGPMNQLQSHHIRLIRNWFFAARQGRELVFSLPHDPEEREMVLSRMREIASCNPRHFRRSVMLNQ